MNTSITKLIAVFATAAGMLTTSAAMAKGPGNSGGNSSSRSKSSGHKSSGNFNAFKLGGSNKISSNHSNSSSNALSKKNTNFSQVFKKQDSFKKQDFKRDQNTFGIGGVTLNKSSNLFKSDKKFDKYSKDFFFKNNNKWWLKSSYSKNYCQPFYSGCYYPTYSCYYPTYSCYDYYTPIYSSSNYGNYSGNITVLQNTEPTRTRVAVGSVLMVNGQAFGDTAGGARLRISGMAMPIEVLEWTPGGVKVRLPQVEITGSTPADIEVVRGDGSLASKTAVELTPSPEQLALGR